MEKDDRKALLDLCRKNLENGYIKRYYGIPPENVNMDYIEEDIDSKISDNKHHVSYLGNAYSYNYNRLFYVVKTKYGQIIGKLELTSCTDDNAEIGLFIGEDHNHLDYGREAILAIINFVKRFSNITKIRWECNNDHAESIALAKNCGFVYSHDQLVYAERITCVYYLTILQAIATDSPDPIKIAMGAAKFVPIIAVFYFVYRLFN